MRFEQAGSEGSVSTSAAQASKLAAEAYDQKPADRSAKRDANNPISDSAQYDSPTPDKGNPDQPREIPIPSQQRPLDSPVCLIRQVRPSDTLDSLAKEVVGAKASKESIEQCKVAIRAANAMDSNRLHEHKTIAMPVKNADGSLSFNKLDNCAEKYTIWPNGTWKMHNSETGRGWTNSSEHDGSSVTKTWGPEARDNSTATSYPDGSYRRDCADGTGLVISPDGKQTHSGPKAEDNYTLTLDKDGNGQKVFLDGTRATCWENGTNRVQHPDKTGRVVHADGTIEGWGPTASHNFKVKFGPTGEKEVSYSDGLKYTENKNGVVTELKQDGETAAWSNNRDGSYTVVELDKHGETKAMYITKNAPPNKRHNVDVDKQDDTGLGACNVLIGSGSLSSNKHSN